MGLVVTTGRIGARTGRLAFFPLRVVARSPLASPFRSRADGLAELDTVLSRAYAGGRDLSGGQWQRVALARALCAVRLGAGVVVLDDGTHEVVDTS